MNKKNFFILTKEQIKNLDLKEIGLLALLCSYANNESGECYPSYETLMKESGINRKNTLSKLLRSLELKGKISIKKNRFKGQFSNNVYIITEYQKRYTANNIENKGVGKGNLDNNQENQALKPSIKNDTRPSIKNDTLTILSNNYKNKYIYSIFSKFETLISDLTNEKRNNFYTTLDKLAFEYSQANVLDVLEYCKQNNKRFNSVNHLSKYLSSSLNNTNNKQQQEIIEIKNLAL